MAALLQQLRRYLVLMLAVFLLHGFFSWIAFTRSEFIGNDRGTVLWRNFASVLAFPLLYMRSNLLGTDSVLVLAVLNSILWAVGVTSLLFLARRLRATQRSG